MKTNHIEKKIWHFSLYPLKQIKIMAFKCVHAVLKSTKCKMRNLRSDIPQVSEVS